MSKHKPENKEEYLAKKREKAKLWYQNIKTDPELYAEYQRKNRLKYEKRLAQKKIVPISEMTSTQQRNQRKKWREERKRRNQRIKEKRKRQSMAENSPPEADIYPVHLIETILLPNPENTEEDFAIKTESQGLSDIFDNLELNSDYQSKHENNTMQEDIPKIEITSCQQTNQTNEPYKDKKENLKPEKTQEVFTIKMESEDLSNQSIDDNPELNSDYQSQYERNKEPEKNTPTKDMSSSQQKMQRKDLREEGNRCQPKQDKRKPQSREELLAKKRERERLRYHYIKNNPELYSEYQRKQNTKYENRKAQKKILLITDMTPRHQKKQRGKWRAESKRRYQQMKERKEREKLSVAENKEAYLTKKREQQKNQREKWRAESKRKYQQKKERKEREKQSVAVNKKAYLTKKREQQKKQRETWRAESKRRYQQTKDKKEREQQYGAENKEAYLTKKREQAKLWYQHIKNNPELYAEYQRKNRLKYEKNKAQKKVVPISEMTSTQQRKQRKIWREESKRRYQRTKDKKEREKQSGAENSSPEDDSYPLQLLVIRKTKAVSVDL